MHSGIAEVQWEYVEWDSQIGMRLACQSHLQDRFQRTLLSAPLGWQKSWVMWQNPHSVFHHWIIQLKEWRDETSTYIYLSPQIRHIVVILIQSSNTITKLIKCYEWQMFLKLQIKSCSHVDDLLFVCVVP